MSSLGRKIILANNSQSYISLKQQSEQSKSRKKLRKISPAPSNTSSETHQSFHSRIPEAGRVQVEKAKKTPTAQAQISKTQIEVYGQVFEDIIKQNSAYGGLLLNVKKNYDEFITRLLKTTQDYTQRIESMSTELKNKERTIHTLEKKKIELLKDKENRNGTIKKLTKDKEACDRSERKYIKLINEFKDEGFPVEEVFNQNFKREGRNKSLPKISISIEEEEKSNPEEAADNSESWRTRSTCRSDEKTS